MPLIFNRALKGRGVLGEHRPSTQQSVRRADAASGSSIAASSHGGSVRSHPQIRRTTSAGSGSMRVPQPPRRQSIAATGQMMLQRTRHSISRIRERGKRHELLVRSTVCSPKAWLQCLRRNYQRWHLKHLIPLFFISAYLLIGALIFVWLEAGPERERIAQKNHEYMRDRLEFIKRIEEILVDQAVVGNSRKRRLFLEEAVDHLHSQLDTHHSATGAFSLHEPQWSFTTAMYFAGTVGTTIGYGDIACETSLGRAATICYAVIGIPLMLLTMNELGKFLYKSINDLVSAVVRWSRNIWAGVLCCRWRRRRKGVALDDVEDLERGERDKVLAASMMSSLSVYGGNPSLSKSVDRGAPAPNGDAPGCGGGGEERRDSSAHRKLLRGVNFSLAPVKGEIADEIEIGEEEAEEEMRALETLIEEPEISGFEGAGERATTTAAYPHRQQQRKTHDENLPPTTILYSAEEDYDEMQRSRVSGAGEMFADDDDDVADEEDIDKDEKAGKEAAPRMPVLVAVAFTLSWVLFCAALFRLWEEWSYGEALYFMFISLLTIGLGDVNVSRRDLMMVCFVFVIIGLSMVSMCINVIQASLEDLYQRLLMKMLTDYKKKLAEGGDHANASLGIIRSLGSSTTARLLMPMLSAETKRTVVNRVREEAREQLGIEAPPLFEHLERVERLIRGGDLPAGAAAGDDADGEQSPAAAAAVLHEILVGGRGGMNESYYEARAALISPSSAVMSASVRSGSFGLRDATAQTELLLMEDKNDQTAKPEYDELAVQTNFPALKEFAEEWTQTDRMIADHSETQTDQVDRREVQLQTAAISNSSKSLQTDQVQLVDEQIQSYVLADDCEVQTEPDVKSRGVQTPVQVFSEADCQCDLYSEIPDQMSSSVQKESRFIKARRNWNGVLRALGARKNSQKGRRTSQQPAMAGWQDVGDTTEEEATEPEHEGDRTSLNWNPVDGKHCERQRSVRDLKSRFEKMERKAEREVRRSSVASARVRRSGSFRRQPSAPTAGSSAREKRRQSHDDQPATKTNENGGTAENTPPAV